MMEGQLKVVGVTVVHQKSLLECLNYKSCLLAGCLLEAWLPILGISYGILSQSSL